jgi:ABC-type sugar transport system ATPase subunit
MTRAVTQADQGPEDSPAPDAAITLESISKRYGGTLALNGIDLRIPRGQIRALVGENGAGKSTCLGVLAGRVVPDGGVARVFGDNLEFGDPRSARRTGIATIFQELTIVPALSTQANVFLGQDLSRRGLRDDREMRRRFVAMCDELGVQIPADVPCGSLSVAGQQLVEIMRALVGAPRVILFDEPTASLAPREREVLYRIIRDQQARGTTIIFVSHNLDEVLALAEEVTVFRGGRKSGEREARAWSKDELVRAMVGRDLEREVRAADAEADAPNRGTVLRVDSLSARGLRDISLHVGAGEIVGVGGLVGSGRSSLLRAIAGDIAVDAGSIEVAGGAVRWPKSVRQARGHGIVMVPEDRKTAGILPGLSASENILVSDFGATSRFGIISRSRAREAAASAARQMHFSESRLPDAARTLSGGNQQKLLLARAAHCRPLVLLADEPTRGVDVGAKAEIMRTLKEIASTGTAVVVVSSELEDLELLCDRVVVLADGEVTGELTRADGITGRGILQLAFRVEELV